MGWGGGSLLVGWARNMNSPLTIKCDCRRNRILVMEVGASKSLKEVVGSTELESVTSCVSSRRSNQLSYEPIQ